MEDLNQHFRGGIVARNSKDMNVALRGEAKVGWVERGHDPVRRPIFCGRSCESLEDPV